MNPCIPLRIAAISLLAVSLILPALADEPPQDPALEQYYSANRLHNRGLHKLAVDEYKAFLAANPNHAKAPMARFGLAFSLYAQRLYQDAEPLFGGLIGNATVKDQDQVHNLHGDCLLTLRQYAKAEAAFDWTVKNSKDEARKQYAMVGLTEALYQQAKWQQVITASEGIVKPGTDSPHAGRVRLQRAVARFELKQYDQAATVFDALLKAGGDATIALHATFLLAECKREAEDLDGAATLYEKASQTPNSPYAAQALYRLGAVRFAQGKYEDAIQHLGAFVKGNPNSPLLIQAKLLLGRAFLETKNYNAATEQLSPLTREPAVAASATLWLAKTMAQQKQYAKVEESILPSLTAFGKDPLLPELVYELADAQLRQGKLKEAAGSFARSIASGPDRAFVPDALWLQAFCLHRAKAYESSLAQCKVFLQKYGKHTNAPDVRFLTAENLFLAGQMAEALPVYQEFLKTSPQHEYAKTGKLRVGQIHYYEKRWKEALASLDAAAQGEAFSQIGFMVGDSHFRMQSWDAAIAAFRAFVKKNPKEPNVDTALFKLALAYQQKGNANEAIDALKTLVSDHPKSVHLAPASVELGRLLYEAKQYGPARKALERGLQAKSPEAAYYLGWVALAEKEDAEAEKHFATVVTQHAKHPLAADAALQQGIIQVRQKEFAKAAGILTALLKTQPKHPKLDRVLFYLGLSMARQKQWNPASQHLQRVVTAFPKSPLADRAMYELAWCDRAGKKTAEAMKRYDQLLAAFPQSPLAEEASLERAELLFDMKKYDDAVASLQKLLPAVKRNDLRHRVLYRLGWSAFRKGDMTEAAAKFEALLKTDPPADMRVIALYQAGEARLKLRENESALKHFAAAVDAGKKTPVHEQALLRKGECEGLTAAWSDSEDTYEDFLKAYPQSTLLLRAQFGMGWAQENQKKYADAIAAYRKVVAARKGDPTSARSQFQIGECLFAMNKCDEAIKEFTRVEVKYNYPEWSSKALLETGRVLDVQGRQKEAAASFRELLKRYPKSGAAPVAKKLLAKYAP